MFDMGFGELLLVGVVALLVLGPERLPGAARTAGRWMGRARATVSRLNSDLERELRAEELRRSLREEARALETTAAEMRALSARIERTAGGADPAATGAQDAAATPAGARRDGG
jgi:sec-independent protein translocase protein TatB